ncbi:MAG: undecaprenyldiphospho-muramoylpentapeptide beta-N-acetylglucosaminyltransferase [Defluviitaleaceae bacterium]|nr:undecaprenyldiphospho-muramoylpentapeptide beta-N-acetylglucosaminyltransferase [Defluviitaleaceae bacterium]
MKKILLTGGGTAGHVIPNLALLPGLRANGFEVFYVGSHDGIERGLAEAAGLPYFGIASGKLRRYANLKNVTDIFRVMKGFADAASVIRKVRPDVIFSKGGFVTVPVVAAGRTLRVKALLHESDITPGLANRLSAPFATKICCSFPETLKHLPAGKGVFTGTPIRQSLFEGNRTRGLGLAGFMGQKPVLLVTGGSQGAAAINACLREALPQLLQQFDVIHLCGRGNLSGIEAVGYAEFEYLNDEMPDVFAAADIVLSRAGANTVFELVALKKPHLLVPLSKGASRGDQILNANSTKKQGFSMLLPEEEMTATRLQSDLQMLYNSRDSFAKKMLENKNSDSTQQIIREILAVTEL